jgi:hypothetical protein
MVVQTEASDVTSQIDTVREWIILREGVKARGCDKAHPGNIAEINVKILGL